MPAGEIPSEVPAGKILGIQKRIPQQLDLGGSPVYFQFFNMTLESAVFPRAARHAQAEPVCNKSKLPSWKLAPRQGWNKQKETREDPVDASRMRRRSVPK